MENTGEAPMYSDDDLIKLLQESDIPTASHATYTDIDDIMFSVVTELFNRATKTIDEPTKATSELPFSYEELIVLQRRSVRWQKLGSVSCQATTEILNGKDAHTITIGLLKYLRNYNWGIKMILTLTAFALTFGDLWFLIRIYADNAVNEPMTAVQRERTSKNRDAYIYQIEANNNFIKNLVNTNQCIYTIIDKYPFLHREMFAAEDGPYVHTSRKPDRFSVFVYWMMRCAIVAATQIMILSNRGLDQYLVGIRDPKEFDKLKSLNEEMMLKLSDFNKRASMWRSIPLRLSAYSDIVEMMERVISPEKDLHPLYHSLTKKKDDLNVLKGKRVLLLISGLNITTEDITNLKRVTINSEKDEIVWIPVLKRKLTASDDVENQLQNLQNSMPWYSIHQPLLITEAAIEAFKIEWDFRDEPILVFLSPDASELNKNAIYMLRIWQNLTVDDLSEEMELQLWKRETWNLKFLVNGIDHIIQEWIRDERYILMYGSNDIDWIRNFISQAHSIACKMFLDIEMVYMGNSNDKDHGRNVQDVIMKEQLSHCLPESSRASFWSRINSMIESGEKFGRVNDPSYKLLQEILRFKNHQEWVLLAKGSSIIGHVPDRIASIVLEDVQKWKTMLFK